MKKSNNKTRNHWRQLKLGDLGTLEGGGTPRRSVKEYYTGKIPWITVKDLTVGDFWISDATEHITTEAIENSATKLIEPNSVIIATRVGLGKVAMNRVPVAINQDLKAMHPHSNVLPEFLVFLVYKSTFDILRYGTGTTVKGINQDDLLNIPAVLPPIPVQERIVQILKKSDDIRRKRTEVLNLVDAILPASFIDMFGDPSNNHDYFEQIPLGKLADIRSGVTKGRNLYGKETVEVPYLRVANVQDGFLDLTEVKKIEVLPKDVDKYHLEDGDILMTEGGDPDKLGRGAVWRNQVEGCIHQNHIFRVRPKIEKLAPEYLAALLRTPYAKHYFLSCAKLSSNLASINSTQVKAFPIPLPPIEFQQKFVTAVDQWVLSSERLAGGLKDASKLFESLLYEAFSGALTAEWEASNADWIASQIELNERLPRLLLLAFIRECIKRVEIADQAVLVNVLMKYIFLLQMEGNVSHRFYHFRPHQYGPLSSQIYAELELLQNEGLLTLDKNRNWENISVVLKDAAKADTALAELPDEITEDVAAILNAYGNLDLDSLAKAVHEKYPLYIKKSGQRKIK